jgi:hypothetical protein
MAAQAARRFCQRPRPAGAFVWLTLALLAAAPTIAAAQDAAPPPPAPQEKPGQPADAAERRDGLPSGVDWRFTLDAAWGNFGFMNSLYTNPRPDQPSGNLGDNWFEGSLKAGLAGAYTMRSGWQVVGTISAVGERTYGAAPTLVGDDASSFEPEDLAVSLRSGKALSRLGENAVDVTVGRAPYQIGHGFLLWDGAAEGGTRGGYWSNARKAFALAAIARFRPGPHGIDAFYLERDELPEADTGTRILGVNYQAQIGEAATLGASYLRLAAFPDVAPQRDGLNVYDARADAAPFRRLPGLAFAFEYALERNGEALDAHAWTAQGAYSLAGPWTPRLSYRYAFFEGDDPATTRNEAFDPLLMGFSDWGTWWQGEIAGEYFVMNSNLESHQVRLHLEPNTRIGTGVIAYRFLLDHSDAVGPQVTSRDVALELDWYMDWKLNTRFTLSLVGAFANPGAAVRQAYGRTKNFGYAMAYVAYSYEEGPRP